LPRAPLDLKLSAWLYKIALNKVRSEKRRKRPASWLVLPFGGRDSGGSDEDLPQMEWPDPRPNPDESVAQRELILKAMGKLPSDQATALMMDAQGYDDEEIATTLECSIGAVRQKLFRGRKTFRVYYTNAEL